MEDTHRPTTGLLGNIRNIKVRDRVRSYFNPDGFDAAGFRTTAQMALLGMVLAEVIIYILLRQSARLGELPAYVTDVFIISISTLEFFMGAFIGWLGSHRRRTVMVIWVLIALVCMLPMFGIPSPVTEAGTDLCTMQYRFLPSEMTPRVAIRLSILVLAGVACALGRIAIMAHTLAYLDEDQPSANTHMNLGILLIVRVVIIHVGTNLIGDMPEHMPWVLALIIVIHFVVALVKMHTFPVLPPAVDKRFGSDRSFLRSLGRVLRSRLAMSQILAMALLSAAVWGYASQEDDFSKAKFHIVAAGGIIINNINAQIRAVFIISAAILCGYLYTSPVMPKYKKRRALGNAVRMCVIGGFLLVVMTAVVSCVKGPLAGLGDTYSQPACGLRCSCDRPWTSFSPVCDPGEMTTYFSPCHAGCASAETAGEVGFYSNCTCASGGRATTGACGDGSCSAAHALQTLLFTCVVLVSILALTCQGTVLLESVDRRDKSVAIGLASGTVSLFTFVGGHALYMWINGYTCVSFSGRRCLWRSSQFVPLVGYTSAGLVGGSLFISIAAAIILHRQKKENQETEEVDVSRE